MSKCTTKKPMVVEEYMACRAKADIKSEDAILGKINYEFEKKIDALESKKDDEDADLNRIKDEIDDLKEEEKTKKHDQVEKSFHEMIDLSKMLSNVVLPDEVNKAIKKAVKQLQVEVGREGTDITKIRWDQLKFGTQWEQCRLRRDDGTWYIVSEIVFWPDRAKEMRYSDMYAEYLDDEKLLDLLISSAKKGTLKNYIELEWKSS